MDELAKAAKLIVDSLEWPIDLSQAYAIPGGFLLTLKKALRTREEFNLYDLARLELCTQCGALPKEKCINKNSNLPMQACHKPRMKARCVCKHQMRRHSQNGQCVQMEDGRKLCRCQRFD